jgi:hypothetical protein
MLPAVLTAVARPTPRPTAPARRDQIRIRIGKAAPNSAVGSSTIGSTTSRQVDGVGSRSSP